VLIFSRWHGSFLVHLTWNKNVKFYADLFFVILCYFIFFFILFYLGCGGDLTTPTGSFVSPNFPQAYTHASECFWTVRVNVGSGVRITFDDFDVEGHSTCSYDYLEVSGQVD
jgi:hypothetical protein